MESDYRNVEAAILLKSLSAVRIILRIIQKFRNIFLKEQHLRKAAPAAQLFLRWRLKALS